MFKCISIAVILASLGSSAFAHTGINLIHDFEITITDVRNPIYGQDDPVETLLCVLLGPLEVGAGVVPDLEVRCKRNNDSTNLLHQSAPGAGAVYIKGVRRVGPGVGVSDGNAEIKVVPFRLYQSELSQLIDLVDWARGAQVLDQERLIFGNITLRGDGEVSSQTRIGIQLPSRGTQGDLGVVQLIRGNGIPAEYSQMSGD